MDESRSIFHTASFVPRDFEIRRSFFFFLGFSPVGAEDAVAVLPKSDGGVNLVLGQPVAWDRTPGESALIILVEVSVEFN